MTQKVYGITSDNGDGSSSIHWFRSQEKVDALLADDDQCETYGMNEGYAEELTFPDDLNLETCGFRFSDDD